MPSVAIVAHDVWERGGGSELMSLATALGFRALGFRVALTSVGVLNLRGLERLYGVRIPRDVELYYLPLKNLALGQYLKAISWIPPLIPIRKYRNALLWIDYPFYKPLSRYRGSVRIIEYIHFPGERIALKKILDEYSRFPWNIYIKPWLAVKDKFLRENPFQYADMVLCNSEWTSNVVRLVHGEKCRVLNPPLPPSVRITTTPFHERDNLVVMVGRYDVDKRYHEAIEMFGRRKGLGFKLAIVGSARLRKYREYLLYLYNLAKRFGLKVRVGRDGVVDSRHDLFLFHDVSREALEGLYSRAKVMFHYMVNEHWGVVVAEAMAHGTPVVMHKSGGAWTDLAEYGRNSLGCLSEDECIEGIVRLMTDEKLWNNYSRRALERARSLTISSYVRKLRDLIEEVV